MEQALDELEDFAVNMMIGYSNAVIEQARQKRIIAKAVAHSKQNSFEVGNGLEYIPPPTNKGKR